MQRAAAILALLAPCLAAPGRGLAQPAAPKPTPPPADPDLAYSHDVHWELDGMPELAGMEPTVRSVLTEDHIQFRAIDGQAIDGFFPGATYVSTNSAGGLMFNLYVRDTATILPMARYYFGPSAMRSSVEAFLRLQYQDGAISATVGPELKVDKASVTSDEETSLVLAAFAAYRATGDAGWLTKDVAGQALLDRLARAMNWLLTTHLDPGTGLIKRGHTTDWGDVKWETDGDASHMQPGDQWTVSIYDQAIAFAALQALASMDDAAGRQADAQRWRARAQQLQAQANAVLWQDGPDRGFYRIHAHLAPDTIKHTFDEGTIVAIGNAAAVYYGLADGNQVPRILDALERARLAARAPKVGLSLDPPYVGWLTGQMAPRIYQNGALWDWWAGRQITGEFEAGYQTRARTHLFELARDWAAHPGIVHEWDSPWLERAGPEPRYAGAAAVVGQAIVEGLYGVDFVGRDVHLSPRLGERSGKVRVYEPATDLYVAYRYQWTPSRVTLVYGSNSPTALSVRLPVPWLDRTLVRLDGQDHPAKPEKTGEDSDLFLVVPSGTHRIDLLRQHQERKAL
jgi:Bacterial alpha-L-rhamnosidase 6 hairpin glycosidase domain